MLSKIVTAVGVLCVLFFEIKLCELQSLQLTCQGTTLIPRKTAGYLQEESKVYEFSKSWPHVDKPLSPAFNQPQRPQKATHPPFWKQIKGGHVYDHLRSGGGNYLCHF